MTSERRQRFTIHHESGERSRVDVKCDSLSTVGETKIGCLTDVDHYELELRMLDTQSLSMVSSTTIDSLRGEGELGQMVPYGLASGSDQWMISLEYGNGELSEPVAYRRVTSIDGSTGDLGPYLDLEWSTDYRGQRSDMLPVMSPNGFAIVGSWGRLYGIQTSLEGLSNSFHPRGLLGGNENRGFAQPYKE